MKEVTPAVVAILLGIVGLATVAIFVSGSSNTAGVVTAGGNSFINAIKCAVAPITSSGCPSSTSVSSTISYGGLA